VTGRRLARIRVVLIRDRMDTGGLDTARDLAQAWPDAELAVIERSRPQLSP